MSPGSVADGWTTDVVFDGRLGRPYRDLPRPMRHVGALIEVGAIEQLAEWATDATGGEVGTATFLLLGVSAVLSAVVDAWGWRPLERLAQDLRFGIRLLSRAPAFTLTAILVLSLGVGVNLAAFQIFERLALAPRPVPEPETLINLYRRSPRSTSTTFS